LPSETRRTGASSGSRCVLVYDADCGPCSRFKRAIDFFDARRRLDFASIDSAEVSGMLDQIPASYRRTSFHLVRTGARIESGAEAIPSLVAILPAGAVVSRAIRSIPCGARAVSFVYSTASRLHDSESCRVHESQAVLT